MHACLKCFLWLVNADLMPTFDFVYCTPQKLTLMFPFVDCRTIYYILSIPKSLPIDSHPCEQLSLIEAG